MEDEQIMAGIGSVKKIKMSVLYRGYTYQHHLYVHFSFCQKRKRKSMYSLT